MPTRIAVLVIPAIQHLPFADLLLTLNDLGLLLKCLSVPRKLEVLMVVFTSPTCDFLGVTVPYSLGHPIISRLRAFLSSLPGLRTTGRDSWTIDSYPDSRFAAKRMYSVLVISASGQALQALRDHDLLDPYLALLGSEEAHRVSRIDVSLDLRTPTAPILAKLRRRDRAKKKPFHLSRKACPVRFFMDHNAAGVFTGSAYFGKRRNAKVMAVVYDKQHEQVRSDKPDPGPVTRYELRVTASMNPSLRDASKPEAIFWHFMAPDILPKPDYLVPAWFGYGQGFYLSSPPSPGNNESVHFASRLRKSAEFADLCAQSLDLPGGRQLLFAALREHGVDIKAGSDTPLEDYVLCMPPLRHFPSTHLQNVFVDPASTRAKERLEPEPLECTCRDTYIHVRGIRVKSTAGPCHRPCKLNVDYLPGYEDLRMK